MPRSPGIAAPGGGAPGARRRAPAALLLRGDGWGSAREEKEGRPRGRWSRLPAAANGTRESDCPVWPATGNPVQLVEIAQQKKSIHKNSVLSIRIPTPVGGKHLRPPTASGPGPPPQGLALDQSTPLVFQVKES